MNYYLKFTFLFLFSSFCRVLMRISRPLSLPVPLPSLLLYSRTQGLQMRRYVRYLLHSILSCLLLSYPFVCKGTTIVLSLFCSMLYCTVLYCTVLYCTVLYCTVLHCTALYCRIMFCLVFFSSTLYFASYFHVLPHFILSLHILF